MSSTTAVTMGEPTPNSAGTKANETELEGRTESRVPPSGKGDSKGDYEFLKKLSLDYRHVLEVKQIELLASFTSAKQTAWAAIAYLIVLFVFGTAFVLARTEVPFSQAVLFSVYTFTSAGFGNVDIPHSTSFLAFVVFYVFAGISALAILFAQTFQYLELQTSRWKHMREKARIVVEGELKLRTLAGRHTTAPAASNTDRRIREGLRDALAVVPRSTLSSYSGEASFLPAVSRAVFAVPPVPKAIALLVGILLLGSLVMMKLEGWSFVESLYFATFAMTTVGYGDLAPTKTSSTWFVNFWLPFNVAFLAVYLSTVAHCYVAFGNWNASRIERRLMEQMNRPNLAGSSNQILADNKSDPGRSHPWQTRRKSEKKLGAVVEKVAFKPILSQADNSGEDGNAVDSKHSSTFLKSGAVSDDDVNSVGEDSAMNQSQENSINTKSNSGTNQVDTNIPLSETRESKDCNVVPERSSSGDSSSYSRDSENFTAERTETYATPPKGEGGTSLTPTATEPDFTREQGTIIIQPLSDAQFESLEIPEFLTIFNQPKTQEPKQPLKRRERIRQSSLWSHTDDDFFFKGPPDVEASTKTDGRQLTETTDRIETTLDLLNHFGLTKTTGAALLAAKEQGEETEALPGLLNLKIHLKVLERLARIIAYEAKNVESEVEINGEILSVTMERLKDVTETWLIPNRAREAFRSVFFGSLVFVGERDIFMHGVDAFLSLNPLQFHSVFGPFLIAMEDTDTMFAWLVNTQSLRDQLTEMTSVRDANMSQAMMMARKRRNRRAVKNKIEAYFPPNPGNAVRIQM